MHHDDNQELCEPKTNWLVANPVILSGHAPGNWRKEKVQRKRQNQGEIAGNFAGQAIYLFISRLLLPITGL